MITKQNDLDSDIARAVLEIDYINKGVISYENKDLDLEVYIYVPRMGCDEVYGQETLYELLDRFDTDTIEAYQSGEEL